MWIQLKQAYFGKSVGERIDCDEVHARMLVEKGIAEPVAGNPLDDVINKGMTSLVEGMTKGIDAAIQDALQSFRTAQEQARKHAVPAIFGAGGDGDPRKNFGDWLCCVGQVTFGKNQKAEASERLEKVYGSMFQPWQKAALAESSGVTGGYVVPPDFYQQLAAPPLPAEPPYRPEVSLRRPLVSLKCSGGPLVVFRLQGSRKEFCLSRWPGRGSARAAGWRLPPASP